MTFIEEKMQEILVSLKIEFIREHPLPKINMDNDYLDGMYTVDFFLPRYGIVIECDGEIYHKNKWKDSMRDKALKRTGIVKKVLHFNSRNILKHTKDVRRRIKKEIK